MLAEQFDVFLFDLDGVIYIGDQPLPHAREALRRLRAMGKTIRFLTNDPVPTRAEIVERLRAMSIDVELEDVVTSGWATAQYLRQHGVHSAYVLGSAGLASEIGQFGIEVLEQGAPEAVVVGCDQRMTYRHLQQATAHILHGAQFVATNADAVFPTPDGLYPATGVIVAAVCTATGRRPTIIGKPYPAMFQIALAGVEEQRAVMVGDSPRTDILGAHQVGITGILVAQQPVRFPVSRDFRTPDATIADLRGLFEPDVSVRPWKEAGFVWPERVEAGVAAVVFDRSDHVLLVKRGDNGLWGLPSGHVEPGETVTEAVKREVLEETGLHVEVVRLIGVYSDPVSQVFAYPSGQISHFVTSCFQCEVVCGAMQVDGVEALEAQFFAPDQLPADLLPMHPQWLSDALAGQAAAFVR